MKTFLVLVILSLPAFSETEVPHVKVQGNCKIQVIPDRGRISFTVEHQEKDQAVAVKKTNALVNDLKKSLTSLKLSQTEFKNTQYQVTPVREYEKDRYVDKGYKASLALELTTSDIARLGEAMMNASQLGVTNVGALETFLSQAKSQAEYLKCLDIAADDARNKAKQLGKKLGFKIGSVISIDETPPAPLGFPHPERGVMKTMALSSDAPTSIETGTQEYSTNIRVKFKIK